MRQRISAAIVVLVTAAGMTGVGVALAGPASAQASCTSATQIANSGGYLADIPTVGASTGNVNCDLGVGNEGTAVEVLQFALNQCYGQHLTKDGIYGSLTEAAVEVAQRDAGIPADGVYGPQTRTHIKWPEFTGGHCYKL
ncbi:MAG TPA: peptidoglycan-binding domain-containing protein [Streptosporangiaceae bacterium]|nr:peptidoglycan-binding domain-containing protein [Streptosporangiaceae bacterium]